MAGRVRQTVQRGRLGVDQPLGDVLDESAERFGPREAAAGDDGGRYSYYDLRRLSDRLALHFLDLGLRPKERVLFQLSNVSDFPIVFFGLEKAGLIPVSCSPRYRLHEMGYFGEMTEAGAYIVPSHDGGFAFAELAQQVRERAPGIRRVLVYGDDVPSGSVSLKELLADPIEQRAPRRRLAEVRPDPMEVAMLLLSGGTTGIPKLIPRTHNDAIHSFKYKAHLNPLFSGTALCVTPMALTMALLYYYLCVALVGGRFVISQTPDPEHNFELIEKEQHSTPRRWACPTQS